MKPLLMNGAHFIDPCLVGLLPVGRSPKRVIGTIRLVGAMRVERVEEDEKRDVVMRVEPGEESVDDDASRLRGIGPIRFADRSAFVEHFDSLVKVGALPGEAACRASPGRVASFAKRFRHRIRRRRQLVVQLEDTVRARIR